MPTFTYWPNMYAKQGKAVSLPWSEWVSGLEEMPVHTGQKRHLQALVLGQMVEGGSRNNRNVRTVEALALDIEQDKKNPKPDYLQRFTHAVERIVALGHEAILYTTFSHSDTDPRYRIILPLSSPIEPKDYKRAMSWINCVTGSVADLKAQKLSQPVFIPQRKPGTDNYMFERIPGTPIDFSDPLIQEVVELRAALGEGIGRSPMEAHTRQACKAVLLGQSYATEGSRDETALRICWHLGRTIKEATLEAVQHVFYWSNRCMGEDAPTFENLHSKLTRGREKIEQDPPPELQPALSEGEEPRIIQFRSGYYFRVSQGAYSRVYTKDEARIASTKHLSRDPAVQLTYMTDTGKRKKKPLETLIEEYGDLANDVLIDLSAPSTVFSYGVLKEATVAWPSQLEPKFDANIDQWLSLLGGEKLKDWLSILADLSRLSSALVIMGPRSIGKTLLAMGCASRFGSNAPARQQALTGHFQEDLARCPLVYIDEDIEDSPHNRNFLSTIRSELSIRERSVNRKYLTPMQMVGAIRCIISANHLPFRQKETSQTGQDLQAIAERFYWINADAKAAEFLHSIPAAQKQTWRYEGIPRYIRHLEETRIIGKEARFGVSGDSEQLADMINIGSGWNKWVTEWMANGVFDGFSRLNTMGDPDVRQGAVIRNGEVYVRLRAVVKGWAVYLPNVRAAPDTRPIADAIKGLAYEEKYKPRDINVEGSNQRRYYHIRRSPLVAWQEDTDAGTGADLLEHLKKDTPK